MSVYFNNLPVLHPLPTHTMRIGQRLLLVGITPQLTTNIYGQVQVVTSPLSAYNLFGPCRLSQSIGEVFRQNINQVLAVGIPNADSIQELFDSLSGVGIDICAILDVTATSANFATYGQIGYQRELQGTPTLFVMQSDSSKGHSALSFTTLLPAQNAGSYSNDSMPAPIQFSRYIVQTPDSIVVNPDTPIQYTVGASATIAGLIASTPSYKTITNKSLKNCKIVNPFNSADAALLAQNGYVTLRNSTKRGVVINYGVTATSSNPNSPIFTQGLHNLNSLRICQYVVSAIQQQTQDYIGNNINSIYLNDTVANTLNILKKQGVILDAAFTIVIDQIASSASINLALSLVTEVTTINVTSQLNYIRS